MADQMAPPGMESKPAPPKQGGLFSGKPKPGSADLTKNVADLAGELNNISRRLMVLEERYTNLRKKTQLTDQNMLNNNKKLITEVQTTNSLLDDAKREVADIKDKMKIMVRELKECAKRQEVTVLKKYIDVWQPVNFVTRDSVTKLVADEVEFQIKDLHIRMQEEEYVKEQIKLALKELKDQGKLD